MEGLTPADGPADRQIQVIRHPGSAVILPLISDDELVVIHNFRPALDREIIEIPAGTLEPGEDPLACAMRELAEETGYRAGSMEPLVECWPTPGICDEKMRIFVARDLTAGATNFDAGERIRVATMGYDAALRAIATGAIQDAKTIVALLLYDGRRGRA